MVGMLPVSAVAMTHMVSPPFAHCRCGLRRGVGASRAFAHDVGGFELVEVVALEVAPHVSRPFEGGYEPVRGGLVPSREGA